jgi:hypothetical protein
MAFLRNFFAAKPVLVIDSSTELVIRTEKHVRILDLLSPVLSNVVPNDPDTDVVLEVE